MITMETEDTPGTEAVVASATLLDLPVEDIRESATNPRRSYDAAALEDLERSIEASGIRVPLLVRPMFDPGDGELSFYELVCGSRRLRAAKNLGLGSVPCIVREMGDDEARDCQIVENLQRADVHPVEEAEAYAAMIEDAAGWSRLDEPMRSGRMLTAEDIAKRVGKPTAYVAQRLKLLTLTLDAKLLFSRGHLTLGHALLLARLTEADQERALRWLLDADPKYDKRDLTEIVRARLASRREAMPGDEEEESEDDLEEQRDHKRSVPAAKYMREGERLINATEAQLKRWIEANVLLKLAGVPWRLEDADLLPGAGACTVCPKRSGSNAALFGDLTAEDDVCLDPACFALKQDAVVRRHKTEAKKLGADQLLKISSKRSCEKLAPAAVIPVRDMVGGVPVEPERWKLSVTKQTVREGQWVKAEPGSCPLAVQGLMVDGADKGKVFAVCADQACKVHKHEVWRAQSSSGGSHDWEKQRQEREAKEKAYIEAETPIRRAIYAAIKEKAKLTADELLRELMPTAVRGYGLIVCKLAEISIPGTEADDGWKRQQAAGEVLKREIAKRRGSALLALAFDILHGDDVMPRGHMHDSRKRDREDLWKLARKSGLDPDAIAKRLAPKPVKPAKGKAPAKKTAAKSPAKRAAKKGGAR